MSTNTTPPALADDMTVLRWLIFDIRKGRTFPACRTIEHLIDLHDDGGVIPTVWLGEETVYTGGDPVAEEALRALTNNTLTQAQRRESLLIALRGLVGRA